MAEPQPPEGLRMIAYRAARDWATTHFHQQPDDRMVNAVLAALFEACKVHEQWGVRWIWPDGPVMATGGFLGPRDEAERWLLDPPSDACKGELVRRYKIFTPAEPVSSTGEEKTDGN